MMQNPAKSNGCMNWSKYPKNRKLIRIQQPETQKSKNVLPFQGWEVATCAQFIGTYNLPFQLFSPIVLIQMLAHTNNFIVLPVPVAGPELPP